MGWLFLAFLHAVEGVGQVKHQHPEANADYNEQLCHPAFGGEGYFQQDGGYHKAGVADDDRKFFCIHQREQQNEHVAEDEYGEEFIEENGVDIDQHFRIGLRLVGNPSHQAL